MREITTFAAGMEERGQWSCEAMSPTDPYIIEFGTLSSQIGYIIEYWNIISKLDFFAIGK